MKIIRAVVLLIAALLLSACADIGREKAVSGVEFSTIVQENFSAIEEPRQVVVKDEEAWKKLWAEHNKHTQPAPVPPAADAACIEVDGGCAPIACPPAGPYGYRVGDTPVNVVLKDCDSDGDVELHDLCGSRVAMVVAVYQWCPGCLDNAELASSLYQAHANDGLATMVVVAQDVYEEPATAELCREIRDFYGLAGTVVYDPEGALAAYGTTDLVLLLDAASKIYFLRRGATEEVIVAAVEAGLD